MPRPETPPPGFPPPVKKAYEQLRNDMVDLALKLTLFKSAFLTPENREVLFKRSADAFSLIQDSVANDITIAIARLMDPPESGKGEDKQNLTLKYLFQLIKEHGPAELHAKVETRHKGLEPLLAPISLLRRKVLAHRDRKTALEEPLNLKLTAQDVLHVCEEFKGIMNEIEGYYEESHMMYDFQVSYSNIPNLVKHLKRGIEAVDEDFRKEMERNFGQPQPYGEVQ